MSALHVLHIDDDADIRTIVALALSLDPDITRTEAASGEEALDLIAGGLAPDVAILDVMMPDMDGPTLLARLRAMAPTAALPVIVMSARGAARDPADITAREAIGTIDKPFDPMSLAAEIRRLLAAAGISG